MRSMLLAMLTLLLLIGLCAAALASGYSTTSGIVLKFNNSPRAEGMGEAHTAISDDEPGAAGWNPAGLFNAYRQEASAMYYHGIVDDAFGTLSYSQPLGKQISIGGSLFYYDAGQFELVTREGASTRVRAEQDLMGVCTGAYQLHILQRDVLLGANVKFIHSTLVESESAFAAALDLGALYEVREVTDDLYAAITIKNLGTPLVYLDEPNALPLRVTVGAAYKPLKGDQHELTLALDANVDTEDHVRANLGAEYWYGKLVAIRTGYKLGYDLDNLTLGLGVRYLGFQMDYAFGLMSALNSTHKVSLGYTLAIDEVRKKEVLTKKPKPTPAPTPKPTPKAEATPVPIQTIMAFVVQKIADPGGQARLLILSVGADKKIKSGYTVVILNSSNVPVAKGRVKEVFATRCVCTILETSGEIEMNAKAEIQLKKAE